MQKEGLELVPMALTNSFQNTDFSAAKSAFEAQYKIYETTILFGLVVTILLCWTLYILQKSRRNSKAIRETNKTLFEEIQKRKTTQTRLNEIHLELGQSSSKLSGIIEGTSDLISAIDLNYKIISFNTAYKTDLKQLFGVDIQDGTNLIDAMAVHPELQKKSKRLWDRALAGEQFTAREQFTDNTQNPTFFEVTYNPIRNIDGEIIGASHIIRNVTDRKLAEDALKKERDFISTVVEASNLLVMVVDMDGRIVKFNRACEITSGYSFEEIDGRVFWNVLIPPEEAAKIKLTHRKLRSSSPIEDYVNHWITKDEQLRMISWRNSFIKDYDGVEFLIATGIDITEKAEFKETQNRILDILETSSDFIGISDMAGNMKYLNRAGKEILGIDESVDLSKRKMISCFPKWAGDLVQSEGVPTAVKQNSWIGETALITPSGREIPVSQLILAHKNAKGEIEYLSTVARDISRQKRLESELATTRDKALETAQIKSAFLANMSHEIRTPMNGIIGLAELLLSTDLTKEQKDYVESVQTSGEMLLTIVNDILDFSKIEAGKFQLETLNFDLREIVESVLELFAEPALRKQIEMALLVDNEIPNDLIGDPRRLRQILTNLVSNAIKFTDKGEIVVRVKLEHKHSDKIELHFSVADTGIGIPQSSQKNLFDAFTQADSTISRRYGGTGLGLTISKQLVELMEGEIGIESEEGSGATFWFTSKFEANEQNLYLSTPDILKGSRILIVDDNDTTRNILLQQLRSVEVLVEEANAGERGLELLKTAAKNNEPFEVAVIDLNMPGLNGVELSKLIKEEPALRKTSILLMPSIDDHGVLRNIKRMGIDAYIFKPIRQTDFYRELSKLLGKNTNDGPDERPLDAEEQHEEIAIGEAFLDAPDASLVGSARILIAEDDRVNQKLLSIQVNKLGFVTDLVGNGQEALDAVRDNEYSLVLMDCQMPVMDGLKASEKIRESESESNTHLPIVAITANVFDDDEAKCLDAGMDGYVRKPVKQDELKQVIAKWMRKPGSTRTTPEIEHLPAKDILSEALHIDQRLIELAEACGDEVNLECIEVFLEDMEISVRNLEKALKQNNEKNIEREAHKLKGSTSNMGARRLPVICQNLIEMARAGQIEEIRSKVKEVSDEFEKLKPIYEDQKRNYEEIVNNLQLVK